MAYKPAGSQPRGDLVRIGHGNLGLFCLRFFPYFVLCQRRAVGIRLAKSHAREDKGTKEGTIRGTNGGTNKKKETTERTNKEQTKHTNK